MVKHQSRALENQLEQVAETSRHDEQSIRVLQAQWALEADPSRIAALAAQFTGLQPMKPGSWSRWPTWPARCRRLAAPRPSAIRKTKYRPCRGATPSRRRTARRSRCRAMSPRQRRPGTASPPPRRRNRPSGWPRSPCLTKRRRRMPICGRIRRRIIRWRASPGKRPRRITSPHRCAKPRRGRSPRRCISPAAARSRRPSRRRVSVSRLPPRAPACRWAHRWCGCAPPHSRLNPRPPPRWAVAPSSAWRRPGAKIDPQPPAG
ncbi:hypothetical protein [Acidocella sp. MX-AZ03]|uniref:hypothetical protein n=1 Tax=Acidocella sp. MX-AZ03 TaxID=2697363 RepID=UPI003FA4CFF2